MNKRTKKSLPVPEVTYAVEVLCFDCARFYTATAIGWDKETFLALRASPDGLYALTKALERPPRGDQPGFLGGIRPIPA